MAHPYELLVAWLQEPLSHWQLQRIVCCSQCIIALITCRTVNLERLSVEFVGSATQESVAQRLRRFMNQCSYATVDIALLLMRILPGGSWILTLDRTEWKFGTTPLNILVLGVVVGDISVPLLWHILPKAGCSNTEERLAIFDCFFVLAPLERINHILADREFVGQEWFTFLQRAGMDFRIRIRKNFMVTNRRGKLIAVHRLFAALPVNVCKTVIRPLNVCGCTLWISGMRLASGDYLIVVTPRYTPTAIQDYAIRWTIELLFGCLKSRGFNCEDTHLTKPERIQTLMALLALAFFWAYQTGQWKHKHQPLTLKKHGRKAKSIFRYGLDELRQSIKDFPLRQTMEKNDFIKPLGLLYGT